jgi:hypothetical protein
MLAMGCGGGGGREGCKVPEWQPSRLLPVCFSLLLLREPRTPEPLCYTSYKLQQQLAEYLLATIQDTQ